MKYTYLILFVLAIIFPAKSVEKNFFKEAKKLFDEEKYEDSKFLFQRNIVYNPKDSESYLYLAKIFKVEENKVEEEKNIKTSLLLDPKNEEAMYFLIDLELERSNFSKVKKLKEDFVIICSKMCEKLKNIENRLKAFEKTNS
tara:strand:- start:732 stop:1157 length:426 start_codon:yes stop_codon:yes gene_type:complete